MLERYPNRVNPGWALWSLARGVKSGNSQRSSYRVLHEGIITFQTPVERGRMKWQRPCAGEVILGSYGSRLFEGPGAGLPSRVAKARGDKNWKS
jgi:hypothetical protein